LYILFCLESIFAKGIWKKFKTSSFLLLE
jgi:hypothetical protein